MCVCVCEYWSQRVILQPGFINLCDNDRAFMYTESQRKCGIAEDRDPLGILPYYLYLKMYTVHIKHFFLDVWMTYNIWYRNIPQCNVVNLTFLFKCEQRTRNDNLEINHFLCSSGSNYNKLRHFCIRLKIIFNSKFNKHVMVMWQIDLLHTTV